MCQACEYTYLVRCIVFMCNTQTHPQTVVHRVCISQVTMSTFVSAGKKQMYSNRNTHTHATFYPTHRTHRHLVWIFRPILSSRNTIKYILVHHSGFNLLNSHCHDLCSLVTWCMGTRDLKPMLSVCHCIVQTMQH